jgi:16S rRNA (adenine1518-N6/adenine1519-N6)-dimethyltransferase
MPGRAGEGPAPHRAKRSLGQNFLIDPNIQRAIVEAIEPDPGDEVLEIGPGRGALTRYLAARVGRLILAELDRDLAAKLREEYAETPAVRVIEGDFLDLTLENVSTDPARLKVIGNIPYNITTPILFSLLERRPRPLLIVLMVQREVADRIVATAGSKTYGALAVGVQSVAEAERVLNVSRRAFRPTPDVDSTVVRIVPHQPPRLTSETESDLRELTRRAFGQRRKQFQRIIRDGYGLDRAAVEELEHRTGMDLRQRPETFPAARFIDLANALAGRS